MQRDSGSQAGLAQLALLETLAGLGACVTIQRADDERVIWVNGSFLSLVGYQHDEVIGKTPEELGCSVLSSTASIRDADETDVGSSLRLRLRTRTGEVRYLEGERDTIDAWIITIAHDVTQHEHIRDELETARTCALEIADALPMGFVTVDASFRISYANTQAAEVMKTTRAGLLGKMFWDEFPSARYLPLGPAATEAMKDRTARKVEQLCPPMETWFEVNLVPFQSGLAVYFEDIGERKHKEGEAARLAALIGSTDDAIYSKTLAEVITSWNPAAERLFGFTAEEALGQTISALLVPPGEHDDVADITAKALSGEQVIAHETRRRRKDGTVLDVALTVSPIYDSGGGLTGTSLIARDVQAASRRAREAAHLAAIVETSADAITSLDPEGRFTSWNPAAEKIFGYTAEEALGRTPADTLIRDGWPDDSAELLERVARGEHLVGLEILRRRKDGTPIEISVTVSPLRDADGQIVGSSAIARDITHEREVERSLIEARERYRSLVEQIPAIIYEWGVDGDIDHVTENYVSPQIEAILGYPAAEWMEDPTLGFARTHPDDLDDVRDGSRRSIEEAVPFSMEFRMIAKDGRVVWLRDEAVVMERDELGGASLMRGVQLDITAEKVEAENVRRGAEERARFVQLLAHELFTPITAIQGAAMTMGARGPELGPEDLDALADGVVRGASRLRRLVHSLDTAARLDRGSAAFDSRNVAIGEVLEVALAEGQFETDGTSLSLSIDPRAALCQTTADLRLAAEALRVAIENAVDFSAEQPVEIELLELDDSLCVLVRDRGPGIPPAQHDQIFEPFTQVDTSDTRSHEGLGLGLFLARRVMRLHGGELDYEDRPGGGSVFTFRFPRI